MFGTVAAAGGVARGDAAGLWRGQDISEGSEERINDMINGEMVCSGGKEM